MGDASGDGPHDDRDWVDRAADLARAVGLNPVRVRWKLEAWRGRWRRRRDAAATRLEHARYRHQSCPQCGRLADGRERVCGGCGAALPSPASRLVHRIGLALPGAVSMSTVLAVALLAVYLRLLLAQGGSPLESFSIATLVRFGAHWPPLVAAGEWWRLGTAMFLHVGLWHILFNLLALSQIGPPVERVFGRLRMVLFFVVTGVAGNLVSELIGLHAVSAGASGGLMGLIGAAAGWGHRSGTTVGRDLRNRMLLWGVYTVAFGWFIHADNGAHIGGFVAGAALGLLVPPWQAMPAALRLTFTVLDVAGLAAAGACVFLAVHPLSLVPVARDDAADAAAGGALEGQVTDLLRRHYADSAEVCRLRDAGRTAEALARLHALDESPAPAAADGGDDLAEFCSGLRDVQQRCRDFPRLGLRAFLSADDLARFDMSETAQVQRQMQIMCEALAP